MPVLNANIRMFNSYAESLKLHNLHFTPHPQKVPGASQKRQIQARLKKVGRKKRRCCARAAKATGAFLWAPGYSWEERGLSGAGGEGGQCCKHTLRPDGCWLFSSDHQPDQGCGEIELGISPAHWPDTTIHAKGHPRVFKPPHLDRVDTWIGGELEADTPNVPARCQPGAGLAATTPHNAVRRRHLTPTLPELVPRPQQEVEGDSRTWAASSPT